MNKESTSKKILLAAGLYPPDIGGPATYAKMIEEQLPQYGFEITTIPFREVRHVPKVFRHTVYAWRIWRHAKNKDVIFALDPISVGLPALFVATLTKTPFMVRLGGDYAWEQGQQRFGLTATLDTYIEEQSAAPLPVRILAWLQSFVVRRAKKAIVPSDYMKSIVRKWGVNDDSIVRIYSVLHPLEVSDTKETIRAELGCTGITIVSAARLTPWKGMEALVEVIARLKDVYPNMSLRIAGDGPERKVIARRITELNVEDTVQLLGALSKAELGKNIRAADIFMLNTAYEGLSHQLLEVMDMGVPIITTNVGGNPELITDGVSGILVSYNDVDALTTAVKRLIENKQLQTSCVQHAKLRTKAFDKTIVTKQTVDTIIQVMQM